MERWLEHVDFVLSREQYGRVGSLTPGNRQTFLYAVADVRAYQKIMVGAPVVRNRFDPYLEDRHLTYLNVPFGPADGRTRRQDGRGFAWRASLFDEKCVATVPLPVSDIKRVHTEQVVQGERMWATEFAVGGLGAP